MLWEWTLTHCCSSSSLQVCGAQWARITQWFRVEGTFKDHLVLPPLQSAEGPRPSRNNVSSAWAVFYSLDLQTCLSWVKAALLNFLLHQRSCVGVGHCMGVHLLLWHAVLLHISELWCACKHVKSNKMQTCFCWRTFICVLCICIVMHSVFTIFPPQLHS